MPKHLPTPELIHHLHPRQTLSLTTDLAGATSSITSTPLPPSSSTWTPQKRPPNLGAIIGGAVGGLAFVAVLIILGVWLYLRRGQKKSAEQGGSDEKGTPVVGRPPEANEKGKGPMLQVPEMDEKGREKGARS